MMSKKRKNAPAAVEIVHLKKSQRVSTSLAVDPTQTDESHRRRSLRRPGRPKRVDEDNINKNTVAKTSVSSKGKKLQTTKQLIPMVHRIKSVQLIQQQSEPVEPMLSNQHQSKRNVQVLDKEVDPIRLIHQQFDSDLAPTRRSPAVARKSQLASVRSDSPAEDVRVDRQPENVLGVISRPEISLDRVQELFSHTCNIHHVSPLIGAKLDPESLSQYQHVLVEALEREAPISNRRTASNYGVRLRKCNMKMTDGDGITLYFEVRQSVPTNWEYCNGNDNNEGSKLLLAGMFSSCGSNGYGCRFVRKLPALNLPLCIYHGQPKVWTIIHQQVGRLFSCLFSPCELMTTQIKALFGLWVSGIERAKQIKGEKIKLSFLFPSTSRIFTSIPDFTVDLSLKHWIQLCNVDSCDDIDDLQQILRNWDEFVKDVKGEQGLNFLQAEVAKIATKSFVLSKNGRVKMDLPDISIAKPILGLLTHILEGRNDSPCLK